MPNFGWTLLSLLSKLGVSNNGKFARVVGEYDPKYYYNELRYLVHCVNRAVKSGNRIDDGAIMGPLKDRYPSCDTLTCLSSGVKLRDEKLKELTDRFVENAVRYGCSFCVPVNCLAEPGNPKIEWKEETESIVKCQRLSDELTKTITDRIGHLIVN